MKLVELLNARRWRRNEPSQHRKREEASNVKFSGKTSIFLIHSSARSESDNQTQTVFKQTAQRSIKVDINTWGHGTKLSVASQSNPWLDFLPPPTTSLLLLCSCSFNFFFMGRTKKRQETAKGTLFPRPIKKGLKRILKKSLKGGWRLLLLPLHNVIEFAKQRFKDSTSSSPLIYSSLFLDSAQNHLDCLFIFPFEIIFEFIFSPLLCGGGGFDVNNLIRSLEKSG